MIAAFLLTILSVAAVTMPSAAYAQDWGDGNGRVRVKDYSPHKSNAEAFSERYTFSATTTDGTELGVDFSISNLGLGDRNVVVAVRVIKGKDAYSFNKSYKESEWSWSLEGSQFALKTDKTSITSPKQGVFHIVHNGDKHVDITFTNAVHMWKPGTGTIKTSEGYYGLHIISPQSRVTGTVGGREVKSYRGYADHVVTDIAPYTLAKYFSRARIYDDGMIIIWRDIMLADKGEHVPWILIVYKGKIVFQSSKAKITYGSTYKDDKSGYQVAKAIQLDAVGGKEGKDSVKIILNADRVTRHDLLDGYSSFVKSLASFVAKPYSFVGQGSYKMELVVSGAKVRLGSSASYTIDYVNK